MGISPEDAREQAKTWHEQYLHEKKKTMIYEAYLDQLHHGFLDSWHDGILDAILTWWPEEKLSWEKANIVVAKWLKPTLHKIPMGDSVGHCPRCGAPIKI